MHADRTDTGPDLPAFPLKVVVVSELMPRDLATGRSTEIRRRIRIDRESFDEVLGKLRPSVKIAVADRLGGGRDPLLLEFPIETMKSFRPEALAERIPAASDLLRARSALGDLRSGKTKLADVRRLIGELPGRSAVLDGIRAALDAPAAAPPPAAPTASPAETTEDGSLDALLEAVSAPESSATRRGADLGRLDAVIRSLVRSEPSDRVDGRVVDAAVREIDAALSEQIDAVLHHPEMKRLEAAWRSLRFLVDRIDFRSPMRLEIVPCPRDLLLEVFDEIVYGPESQGVSDETVGFVIADYGFDRSPDDIELLRALSERAAALSAPLVASAGPAFLGIEAAADIAKRKGLREVLDRPESAKWKGLRETGPSRWIGLAFNRFLLRPPYAPGDWAARGFDYVEAFPDDRDEHRLWANAAWAIAVLACRSYARIGWCTDIMGQRASGTIEDLPVRRFDRPGGEPVSFPLETSVSDDAERDLTAYGVMALTAPLNSDRAFLRFAPSAHLPRHYQDPTDRARAKLQSTLPFQLFVGRLVNYAMLVERILVPGRGGPEIAAGYDRALRALLGSAGPVAADAVQVSVVPNREDPSSLGLNLKVRWPGAQSLPGAGEVELSWPLST